MLTVADIADAHDFRGLDKDLEALKNTKEELKVRIGNGSTFVNIETGDVYFYDRENDTWNLI